MKSDGFSVEQVQKYLYRINNKTVYVFWEIREKQADTSEFPIIKDKSKPYCHGRLFPCVFSLRQVAENTHGNKRPDNGFDFGKDYRDSLRLTRRMTVSLMKKGGPPLYLHKSGRKYGIYGQTWQCLMKKTPPHEKTGTSAPSALHNPPFAPVPASSPFLRIPYPCFHGMFPSRKTSLSDI